MATAIYAISALHRPLGTGHQAAVYQRSFITSTGVQPRRPERTQSWFLRIAAIVSASQRPAAISPITKANATTFTIMRWR